MSWSDGNRMFGPDQSYVFFVSSWRRVKELLIMFEEKRSKEHVGAKLGVKIPDMVEDSLGGHEAS